MRSEPESGQTEARRGTGGIERSFEQESSSLLVHRVHAVRRRLDLNGPK